VHDIGRSGERICWLALRTGIGLDGKPFANPVLDATDHLLDPKATFRQGERRSRRTIATRTPAVGDHGNRSIEYVIRSRREACGAFGGTGVRYAKMKALALDAMAGSFRFEVVRNPYCNDRRLIPPED